jgi:hypothetical protein
MSKVPSVQCPRCGFPIGKVMPLFRKLRQEKINTVVFNGKNVDKSNHMVISTFAEDFNLIDVFKKLKIRNICCKSLINTEITPDEISVE